MTAALRRVALAWLAATVVAVPALADAPAPEPAPDIFLIVIDTWRWDALGANGGGRTTATPCLDALARRGFLFRRAYSASSWTLPSMASVLTGRYPTVHGAFGGIRDVTAIRDQVPTLAEILTASGYRTRAVISAVFLAPRFGFARGFERFDYVHTTSGKERRAGPTVDNALDLVADAPEDEPLFFLLHLFDPHLPYDPPPPWDTRWTGAYDGPLAPPFDPIREIRARKFSATAEDAAYIRALYDGEVAYTDRQVGRFLRQIETLRTSRRRWIFVTADHGEEFGEHGGWEHGHSMYGELVRVPLIAVPPGGRGVEPGVVGARVRTLDLFTTIAKLAGAELPADLPGISLVERMRDPAGEEVPAYSEREHLGIPSLSLREDGHALIVHPGGLPPELYDLASDPAEQRNLAGELPGVLTELEEKMRSLRRVLEEQAAALGPAGEATDLDPELEERLRALGYLGD